MNGSVGWYRKDFELPDASAALDWAVRFESVNYRARVWLNGREVGSHAGAYLPFTVPLERLRRVNRLVVRVDSRRTATDLPPGRDQPAHPAAHRRLVELRRHPARGLPPEDRHAGHRVGARHPAPALRDLPGHRRLPDARAQRHRRPPAGDRHRHLRLPERAARARARCARARRRASAARCRVPSPHLWSPRDPFLYPAAIEVRVGGRLVGRWNVQTGVRSVRVTAAA